MLAAERYKINPRRRFGCITAVSSYKVAKFELTDEVTFENVFPRLAVQMAKGLVPSMFLKRPPTRGQAEFTQL